MGSRSMKDVGGTVLAGSSLPFLGRPSHFRSKFSFFFFRFETVGICRKEWEMPKENDAFMVSSAHESRQKLEIGANDSACVPFRRLRA